MSEFYGSLRGTLPLTPFVFDRIYEIASSKIESVQNYLDSYAETDGVYVSRYVLIQDFDKGEYNYSAWQKIVKNNQMCYQHIANLSMQFDNETLAGVEEVKSLAESISLENGKLIFTDGLSVSMEYIDSENKLRITLTAPTKDEDGNVITVTTIAEDTISIPIVDQDKKIYAAGGAGGKAYGSHSLAYGSGCVAGARGFEIATIIFEEKQIYLSKGQYESAELPYEIGDIVTITRSEVPYLDCGTIDSIVELNGENLYIITLKDQLPFASLGNGTNYLWVKNKPNKGNFISMASPIAIGYDIKSLGTYCFGVGRNNYLSNYSICFGNNNKVNYYGFAQGYGNLALGQGAVAIGSGNTINGTYDVSIGVRNTIDGNNSVIIGGYDNKIWNSSNNSFIAGGINNNIYGNSSFCSGEGNQLKFDRNYALGYNNTISSSNGIALGLYNNITSPYSFSLGHHNKTEGWHSVAIGVDLITNTNPQIVVGQSNKKDANKIFIVGNGICDYSKYQENNPESNRRNAFAIGKDNNAYFGGKIYNENGTGLPENIQEIKDKLDGLIAVGQDDPTGKDLGNAVLYVQIRS